jgi:hypothetical protein
VRRRVGELELVVGRGERHLTGAEAHLVQPIPGDVTGDIAGVTQAVDVADLVAVVGGDGYLGDGAAALVQLQDDLGVEVEAVGVRLERDLVQRAHLVSAIPAVPLAQVHAGDGVLEPGEDAVADIFVEGHASLTGRSGREHSRAEHGVAFVGFERRDEILDHLGGVLPVAVQQHDDVETVIDSPPVSGLLVAAIAQIAGLADQRDGQVAL